MHQNKSSGASLSGASPSMDQDCVPVSQGDLKDVPVSPLQTEWEKLSLHIPQQTSSPPTTPEDLCPSPSDSSSRSYSPVTYDGSVSSESGPHPLHLPRHNSTRLTMEQRLQLSPIVVTPGNYTDKRGLSASCELLRDDGSSPDLFGATSPISLPGTPRKKKRSFAARFKARIKFRKKSKSTGHSTQTSPPAPTSPITDPSLPDFRGKPRSHSEVTESQSVSPNHVRPRSYTKLTGHITAKYRSLGNQNKHNHALPSLTATEKKPQVLEHPLAKPKPLSSTVEMFQQCLSYKQLKYKLSIAFQSIHKPINHPTTASTKQQLTDILTDALQRAVWMRQSSDASLLSETLTLLQPLKEEQ